MGKAKPRTKNSAAAKVAVQITWLVAVYIRLSREDGNEESESVVNQKKILMEFVKQYFDGQHVIVDF